MYMRLAIVLLASLFLAGAGWKCYVMGKQTVEREWAAEKAAMALAAAEAAVKQQAIADSVARTVHQAARQERAVYRTLLKDAAHVQSDCALPADLRLLHDAAATAEVPNRSASGIDGSPVAAEDLAETVIENYEACRDNARRLEALQTIIRAYNGD